MTSAVSAARTSIPELVHIISQLVSGPCSESEGIGGMTQAAQDKVSAPQRTTTRRGAHLGLTLPRFVFS